MSEKVIYKNKIGNALYVYMYDDVLEVVKVAETGIVLGTHKDHHGRLYVVVPGLGRVFLKALKTKKFWAKSMKEYANEQGISLVAAYKRKRKGKIPENELFVDVADF